MSRFRAPGRVNLIGEHTDYTGGFVMPAAIQFSTWVDAEPRPDRRVSLRSSEYGDSWEFDLDDPRTTPRRHWSDYVRGIAVMLERAGHRLRGADLSIRGEVPIGAGLSSSAALEVSTGFALLSLAGAEIDRVELARLCQQAENEFVGTRCGIMDQFVSCNGRAGHALMLDCRSLEYRLLPLPDGVKLIICNTLVKHDLATGEYNVRRAECEKGERLLGVRSLRDATLALLEQKREAMPELIYRRCRHVIGENARVEAAAAALGRTDLESFGRLMAESHRSLRDDFEVSCEELDLMVEAASGLDGVYGARMTGGGFGGCTVNLVRADAAGAFVGNVACRYREATGIEPKIYVCEAVDGVGQVAG